MSSSCPSDVALQNLIAGSGETELEAHLDECKVCAARLEELAGAATFESQFARAAAPGAHESVELTHLIDHLKASPIELSPSVDESAIAARFPAGAELDGYRIEGLIARGGMGVVLKAYDPELERAVAIKLLDPARFSGPEAAERFLREARAAAAIDHEHVLPVFTTGTTEDLPYLVMPFVEGETLQDRVGREPLDSKEVLRIAKAVAKGLDAAHSAGLVHRDVKPANILLEPDGGRVWIADFGLARAAEDPSITREGVMAGTPQFMSPEQADGGEADERSDLFSLGAVIYFMLAGRPPFDGSSAITVLRQVSDSSPDWSRASSTPAWMGRVLRRMMSKDPGERPGSAAEVLKMLEAGRTKAKSVRWWWVAAVLACFSGAVYWVGHEAAKSIDEKIVATVDGSRYILVSQAIEEAEDGAVIEIVRDTVIRASNIPTLDRPLTIRAAEGVSVEIERADLLAPVLDIRAAVTFEGVKITQTMLVPGTGEHLPPLVRVGEGGQASFKNCSIMRPRPGKAHGITDGADGRPPVCIEVDSGGILDLANTELISGSSIAVSLKKGARANISECVISCENAIFCDGQSSVKLERSAVMGLVTFMVAGEGGKTEIVLNSNVLLSVGAVLWTEVPILEADLEVKSGGNLYCPQMGYAVTGRPEGARGMPSKVSIKIASRWREFTSEPDGIAVELPQPRVVQMRRRFSIADYHPAPELALERINSAFRLLRSEFPQMGCDVDAAGARKTDQLAPVPSPAP